MRLTSRTPRLRKEFPPASVAEKGVEPSCPLGHTLLGRACIPNSITRPERSALLVLLETLVLLRPLAWLSHESIVARPAAPVKLSAGEAHLPDGVA